MVNVQMILGELEELAPTMIVGIGARDSVFVLSPSLSRC